MFQILAVAALIAFAATPLVIKLAWKFDFIDDPRRHKHPKVIHTQPTPRGGGLAIYLAILTATLLFLPLDKHLIGILAGATTLLVMGLMDDKFDISPYPRILVQFLAAAMPIAAGIGVAFLSSPVGGIVDLSQPRINFYLLGEMRSIWVLSDLFALFWIVTIINFLNMGAKGVDGQLPGIVAIAALVIAFQSLKFSADITQWPVTVLALITAGAFLGFLPWNIYPQKIMPSFSGSNIGGFMLAVLAILSTTKVGTLTLVLGVPLIDTGYVVIKRILSGKSPFWGDRGHLHHRLLDAGLSKAQVAALYWLFTGVLGVLALNLNTASKFYTIIGVALFTGGLILWLTKKSSSPS
jgi:UDP-GlcNAc:undecaprenyl-phosphate GlcNAc-1-phosphate transferase